MQKKMRMHLGTNSYREGGIQRPTPRFCGKLLSPSGSHEDPTRVMILSGLLRISSKHCLQDLQILPSTGNSFGDSDHRPACSLGTLTGQQPQRAPEINQSWISKAKYLLESPGFRTLQVYSWILQKINYKTILTCVGLSRLD